MVPWWLTLSDSPIGEPHLYSAANSGRSVANPYPHVERCTGCGQYRRLYEPTLKCWDCLTMGGRVRLHPYPLGS